MTGEFKAPDNDEQSDVDTIRNKEDCVNFF